MIFGKELMDKVLSGEKTVTRRIGDTSMYYVGKSYTASDRSRWSRKGTPYRKCRIKVLANTQIRLDAITDVDAGKEGFDSIDDFKKYWTQHLRFPWNPELLVWRIQFKRVEEVSE